LTELIRFHEKVRKHFYSKTCQNIKKRRPGCPISLETNLEKNILTPDNKLFSAKQEKKKEVIKKTCCRPRLCMTSHDWWSGNLIKSCGMRVLTLLAIRAFLRLSLNISTSLLGSYMHISAWSTGRVNIGLRYRLLFAGFLRKQSYYMRTWSLVG